MKNKVFASALSGLLIFSMCATPSSVDAASKKNTLTTKSKQMQQTANSWKATAKAYVKALLNPNVKNAKKVYKESKDAVKNGRKTFSDVLNGCDMTIK